MLKSNGASNFADRHLQKKSNKPKFIGALESGLNRRAFLRQSGNLILLSSLAACKPDVPSQKTLTEQTSTNEPTVKKSVKNLFNDIYSLDTHQKSTLQAVQLQLFPADGDGPSANDINALSYLEWALTDPDNRADGDGDFIVKGIGWLDSLAEQTQGNQFVKLPPVQQDKVLQQISRSSAGENWMSILIYYLMEALLFDPYYGGNPNRIGWTWLNHQPGFPAPDDQTNYRLFL